eukprot:TRINITY_DN7761_c0_g1_i2.p1 TRINITY_DN7761_c0_g1~~TRINITY_DN7761_c0_g1_i2.p1  ORF type:complete len:347 (-),score=47.13 TRINITY_DN7761_c0_g1_i2:895-1935(-)
MARDMVWTAVILTYRPATPATINKMLVNINYVDMSNIIMVEPRFNKKNVVILQSNSWPDLQSIAETLNSVLKHQVEIILSLEHEAGSEPYRTLVGYINRQHRTRATQRGADTITEMLQRIFRAYKNAEIMYIANKHLVIVTFPNPQERRRAAEDKKILNEGTKYGKYYMEENTNTDTEEIGIVWRTAPYPEGTHPFQLTLKNGTDKTRTIRDTNKEKIFTQERKDGTQIIPSKVFQDQMEGNPITVMEFDYLLDAARYMRTGIEVKDTKLELIQLANLKTRLKEIRDEEDNSRKQITIRGESKRNDKYNTDQHTGKGTGKGGHSKGSREHNRDWTTLGSSNNSGTS